MIDRLVPHQARWRFIELTVKCIGLPMERMTMAIHNYGITTAATIPPCLWDYEPH
jgi:3-oxoacyl-[acyl-carrier-protein] synthase-3